MTQLLPQHLRCFPTFMVMWFRIRGRIFSKGGDDAEHPTDITMDMNLPPKDTHIEHSKVNSILYACPFGTLMDGILLDPPLPCILRLESYTSVMEEVGRKRTTTPSMREAWKRRRKRGGEPQGGEEEDHQELLDTPWARGRRPSCARPTPKLLTSPCARGPEARAYAPLRLLTRPCARGVPWARPPRGHGVSDPRAHGPHGQIRA